MGAQRGSLAETWVMEGFLGGSDMNCVGGGGCQSSDQKHKHENMEGLKTEGSLAKVELRLEKGCGEMRRETGQVSKDQIMKIFVL